MLKLSTIVNKIGLINYIGKKKINTRKDMRSVYNREKLFNPIDFIIIFLDEKKIATLGEIYKEFQNIKSSYSKPAIFKILKKMENDDTIKNIESKNKHPKYSIIDTVQFKIKSDAYAFKDQISANALTLDVESNELDMIKSYPNNFQKKIISETIFKFGLISFYTCLLSYRKSMSPIYGIEKNKKLHELWLRNAMSFENNLNPAKFSKLLKTKLEDEKREIRMNEVSENEEESDYSIKKITQQEMLDATKDLEKTFSKMFPEWYDEFQSSEYVVDTRVNDLMRKVCIEHPEYLLS